MGVLCPCFGSALMGKWLWVVSLLLLLLCLKGRSFSERPKESWCGWYSLGWMTDRQNRWGLESAWRMLSTIIIIFIIFQLMGVVDLSWPIFGFERNYDSATWGGGGGEKSLWYDVFEMEMEMLNQLRVLLTSKNKSKSTSNLQNGYQRHLLTYETKNSILTKLQIFSF